MKRWLCVALVAPYLCGCVETDREYATVEEARAAGVFSRHELPDVLPASANSILVRTRWWKRQTSGAFCVPVRDRESFLTALDGRFDPKVWGEELSKVLPALSVDEVTTRGYASDHGRWTFSCTTGDRCSMCTWTRL